MELNYFNKIVNNFSQPLSERFTKNFNVNKNEINIKKEDKQNMFHTDCKFSRKKVCYCRQMDSQNNDKVYI